MTDEQAMAVALSMARLGRGRVSPNPEVGCVILRGGRVVGQGAHLQFGGPHAEVAALNEAGRDAVGATLYVTLEPCTHYGKTPPCTDAILRSSIKRVVIACRDPSPRAGGGADLLRRSGIAVTTGVLAREAALENAPFLKSSVTGLPLVRLKVAATLDGRVTGPARRGERITGPEAHEAVHALRMQADAVLTGVGTVLADDPLLTARPSVGPAPRQPLRVVLDSQARTPITSRIVTSCSAEAPVLVLATEGASGAGENALLESGVEVSRLPAAAGRLDLASVWKELGRRRVNSVLVEAGPELNTALVRGGWVDELLVFIAPRLMGESGLKMLGDIGPRAGDIPPSLTDVTVERVGEDVLVRGWLGKLDWLAAAMWGEG